MQKFALNFCDSTHRPHLSIEIVLPIQSQKTQGFCVADFVTLSDERRSRSKLFPLFIWIKEPCVRKFEGLERSKLLGISQTKLKENEERTRTRTLSTIVYSKTLCAFRVSTSVIHVKSCLTYVCKS